jgi:uncharacterized protein (DUF924 family)
MVMSSFERVLGARVNRLDESWTDPAQIDAVLDFWLGFDESDPSALERQHKLWFSSGSAFDRKIASKFAGLFTAATNNRLTAWETSSRGRLALIIVIDQFSRNLRRGHADAFGHDDKAQSLCLEGITIRMDQELSALQRVFFYMPLQHAESIELQQQSVEKFEALIGQDVPQHFRDAFEGFADYARLHRDIIAKFGRFPHRNAILGRTSSPAELEYLASGGPSFGQRR